MIVLSSSLNSLVKNFGENKFKHLSQDFDSELLDLVKQKDFYSYESISSFENVKEKLPSEHKFYSLLNEKELVINSINMLSKSGINLKWK